MANSPAISGADAVQWLQKASNYFERIETHGEDKVYWSNVANAESAKKIAALIENITRDDIPPVKIKAKAKSIALDVFAQAVDSDDDSHSLDTVLATDLVEEAVLELIESLKNEIARFKSDRAYTVGFSDGWNAANERSAGDR